MAAPVHGVGPVTAMIGGLIAFAALMIKWRFTTALEASSEVQRNGRLGRWIARSVSVITRAGLVGVAVGLLGLLIWGIAIL